MARISVRSYFRRDGTFVRAHSRSGGQRGVAAAALAAVVAISGFTVMGSGSGSGAPKPTAAQVKVKVQERQARSKQATTLRLGRKGYQVRARSRFDGSDCAGHAYGSVAIFFRDRPCLALARTVFEVRDRRGKVVLIAVSSVGMPDEAGARAYLKLVDRHGTGNITELSRDQGPYRSVRYVGIPYESWTNELVVTNVQVQPVGRGPGDTVLAMMAEAALA